MKIIFYKFLTTGILILVFILNVNAQLLLKNRLSIDLNYGFAKGMKYAGTLHNGIILPSLLVNMEKAPVYSFSGKYIIKNSFGVNLSAGYVIFENWNGDDHSNLYESAKLSIWSFKPGIILSTPFRDSGLLNRFNFDMAIGPTFGLTHLVIGKSLQLVNESGGWMDIDLVTKESIFGAFVNFSARFAITQQVDFHLNYGLNKYWVTSELISDSGFMMHYIGGGIGFRLMVDKYYLYE